MKRWSGQIIILILLAVILAVPVAMAPSAARRDELADRLVIVTPHNEQIRHEFARAFNDWRVEQGLEPIEFDYRTSGGTSDLRKGLFAQYEAAMKHNRADDGIGLDLFFGGGDYEHDLLARGIDGMSLSVPMDVTDDVFFEAFPDPRIGSERLYHPDRLWVGVALSSFGIVYNRDVLEEVVCAPLPRQWVDLADPKLFRWIALADPAHSGSIAVTYNVILRRHGWHEGWNMLRRVFANARYFSSSASKVSVDVSAGEAAAGMCIDFYGRFQAGAIGRDRVRFVDPPYTTAITADPVSILRGAPHQKLANQFVLWLITPDAQQLWQRKCGTTGGPEKFELRRLPARADVYTEAQMYDWTDQVNPFDLAKAFPDPMPNFYRAVAPIAHAMAIDVHDDLQAAWRAIMDENEPEMRRRMVAIFDAMPDELTIHWPDDQVAHQWRSILEDPSHPCHREIAESLGAFADSISQRMKDRDRLMEDRLRWTVFFRHQYRRVIQTAQGQLM